MAGRISQSIVQVLNTGTPNARISQSIVQVLSKVVINPDVSDDLNNWGDAIEIWSPNNQLFSDDLNNWLDLAERFYGIFTVALDINSSDWLSKEQTKGKSLKDSWKDGLEYILEGADVGLFISIEDLDQHRDDELGLGYGLIFSDDLTNWNDVVSLARSYQRQAYDTMFYNWADALVISYLLSESPNDSLQNWSDELLKALNNAISSIGDQFVFSDQLNMVMDGYLSLSDTFSLSDVAALEISTLNSFSDDLNNLSDDVSINSIINLTLSVGDDLDNLSDALNETNDILLGGSDLSYLRRYLNDVT